MVAIAVNISNFNIQNSTTHYMSTMIKSDNIQSVKIAKFRKKQTLSNLAANLASF